MPAGSHRSKGVRVVPVHGDVEGAMHAAITDAAADAAPLVLFGGLEEGAATAPALLARALGELRKAAQEAAAQEARVAVGLLGCGAGAAAGWLVDHRQEPAVAAYLDSGRALVCVDQAAGLHYLTGGARDWWEEHRSVTYTGDLLVPGIVAIPGVPAGGAGQPPVDDLPARNPALFALRGPHARLRDLLLDLPTTPDPEPGEALYVAALQQELERQRVRESDRQRESDGQGDRDPRREREPQEIGRLYYACHLELPSGLHREGYFDHAPLLRDGLHVERLAVLAAECIARELRGHPDLAQPVLVLGLSADTLLLCARIAHHLATALHGGAAVRFASLEKRQTPCAAVEELIGDNLLHPASQVVLMAPSHSTFATVRAFVRALRREGHELRVCGGLLGLLAPTEDASASGCVARTGPIGGADAGRPGEPGTRPGRPLRLDVPVNGLDHAVPAFVMNGFWTPVHAPDPCPSHAGPLNPLDLHDLRPTARPDLPRCFWFGVADPPEQRSDDLGAPFPDLLWERLADLPRAVVPVPVWRSDVQRRYQVRFGALVLRLAQEAPATLHPFLAKLDDLRGQRLCVVSDGSGGSRAFAQVVARHLGAESDAAWVDLAGAGQDGVEQTVLRRVRGGRRVLLAMGYLDRVGPVEQLLRAVKDAGGEVSGLACFVVTASDRTLAAVRRILPADARIRGAHRLALPLAARRRDRSEHLDQGERALRRVESWANSPYLRRFLRHDVTAGREEHKKEGEAHRIDWRDLDVARITADLYLRGPDFDLDAWLKDRTRYLSRGVRSQDTLEAELYRRILLMRALAEPPFLGVAWARVMLTRLLDEHLSWLRADTRGAAFAPHGTNKRALEDYDDGDRAAVKRLLTATVKRLGQLSSPKLVGEEALSSLCCLTAHIAAHDTLGGSRAALRFFYRLARAVRSAADRWAPSIRLETVLDRLYFKRFEGAPQVRRWIASLFIENTVAVNDVLCIAKRQGAWDPAELAARLGEPPSTAAQGALPTSDWHRDESLATALRQFFAYRGTPPGDKASRIPRRLGALQALDEALRPKGAGASLDRLLGLAAGAALARGAVLALRAPGDPDEPVRALIPVAQFGAPDEPGAPHAIDLDERSEVFRALETGIPTVLDRAPASASDRGLLERWNACTLACFPMASMAGTPGDRARSDGALLLVDRPEGDPEPERPFEPSDLRAAARAWVDLSRRTDRLVGGGRHLEEEQRLFLDHLGEQTRRVLEVEAGEDSAKDRVEGALAKIMDGWETLLGVWSAVFWYFDDRRGEFCARAARDQDLTRREHPVLCARRDRSLLGKYLAAYVKGEGAGSREAQYISRFLGEEPRHEADEVYGGARDLVILPVELRDGRLLACLTLYLPEDHKLTDAVRLTRLDQLTALSPVLLTRLERALYTECQDVIQAMLDALRVQPSERSEVGAMDGVAAVLRDQLKVGAVHLFHAEDGTNWYQAGSTVPWTNMEARYQAANMREKVRFAWDPEADWPREKRVSQEFNDNGDRTGCRRRFSTVLCRPGVEMPQVTLPSELRDLLAAAGARGKDVMLHLLGDVQAEEHQGRALLVLVGPRTVKHPAAWSPRLSVEEARKLALIGPVLLWSIRARLDALGKDRFVSMWNHGTGGALQSMRTDLLELRRAYDPRRRDFVNNTIEAMAPHLRRLHLAHLTGDLYLELMQGHSIVPRTKAVRVQTIIDEVKDLCRDEATYRKRINITHAFVDGAPYDLALKADPDQAVLALHSVVDNAVKYSYFDHPRGVRLSVTQRDQTVAIEVTDFGVPIPPQDLDRVFDLFYRSQVKDKRYDRAGTGIGLYIARELARAHGGTVRAACAPDSACKAHGVTVTLTWPKA